MTDVWTSQLNLYVPRLRVTLQLYVLTAPTPVFWLTPGPTRWKLWIAPRVLDRGAIHNFHLVGPGVNQKTGVGAVKTYSWRVTLKRGTYKFSCDVHTSVMHGVLRVT